MYAGVRSNIGAGIHTKHKLPRFPYKASELEAITGLTIDNAYGCQEGSGSLIDLKGGADLTKSGNPLYRRPMTGLIEQGVHSLPSVIGGWSSPTLVNPGVSSFLLACYSDFDAQPGLGGVEFTFGINNRVGLVPYAVMRVQGPMPTFAAYTVILSDGVNSKSIQPAIVPEYKDHISRGWIFLYDAGTGNIYTYIAGMTSVVFAAMGTWTGISGAQPSISIGAFNNGGTSLEGSDQGIRYAFYAKGAQLDNWNGNIKKVMTRLGWM